MPDIASLRSARTAAAAAVLAVGGLTLAAVPAQAAGIAPAAARAAIAGTRPEWATASARVSGAAGGGDISAQVYLAGRNPAGLSALATAVSTPGNARYRHFLSPAQLNARFANTPAQLRAVEGWLRSAGLTITSVHGQLAGGYIGVRGLPAAVSQAFGVRFGRYRLAGQGIVRAPDQAATAPARVAPYVLTVAGLSSARQQMQPLDVTGTRPSATAVEAAGQAAPAGATAAIANWRRHGLPAPPYNYWIPQPCAAWYGQKIATGKPAAYGKHQPWAVCGYTPRQVRSAYGVTASGMTGQGQTVAVVDAYASPTMQADADAYARVVGDHPFRPGQYRQYLPATFTQAGNSQCGAAGWYGEQTLDVESVHGAAPDADVRFVAAANCQDSALSAALAFIVNHHLASIVTNSYGDTEAGAGEYVNVYHLIFTAGAAEGIDFMFSAGDNGYESPGEDPGYSHHIQVDYPTSDPYATSVGGTSLAIGRRGNYEFETSWGTLLDPLDHSGRGWQYPLPGQYPAYYDGSGGGGTSTLFRQPAYQAGVVPASLSQRLPDGRRSAHPMREVPDISAYADPATGFLFGETTRRPDGKGFEFALSRIGGTSLSSPTFAGIEADAQQAAGGPLGFANPLIYQAFRTGDGAYHDVVAHPRGPAPLAQVRANYARPYVRKGPLVYYLRTLGINGEWAAALRSAPGYDAATGVGSPRNYIEVAGRIAR